MTVALSAAVAGSVMKKKASVRGRKRNRVRERVGLQLSFFLSLIVKNVLSAIEGVEEE